jgi:predicted Zn-dependent peptidase
MRSTVRLVLVLACLAVLAPLVAAALEVECETYTLPNGLTVILHEDHTLPQVVVDTWFHVGSKDDPPGRSGFAHLFEHLMFMGTERAPDSSYDDIMEAGGGANNAGTGMDQTVYYSWGPSSLLPTLLWLDADRLDGLGKAMTQSKLDLQREVVLNERRQNYENAPYGVAAFLIPEALYPEDHPYRSSGIGEPAQLEAATLEDVVSFFDAYYVPANASLVVAGDFNPEDVRPLIARTFGAVPTRPPGPHRTAAPIALERELRRITTDRVEAPKLFLVWPSPPAYRPGDAEMDLIADILGDGPSSRLHQRLIVRDRTAREIEVYQGSQLLGSEFHIEVTALAGGDLEQTKRAVLEELATFAATGPSGGELERVKAATEASFLRGMEDLRARADSLNEYRFHFGEPDAFARDLARYTAVDGAGLRRWAAQVLGEGRLDLRVLPLDASVEDASLDQRPGDFPQPSHQPPLPERFTLGNGIPVDLISRPGSGLFQGALVVEGGERVVSAAQAGLAPLTATMMTAGAGGRSAAELADAIASLGARVRAAASEHATTVTARGLASRLPPTLDLFADAVLRPNLLAEDFERERDLAVEDIRSRAEDPRTVAFLSSSSLLFDRNNPFGRPAEGYLDTVGALTLDDVRATLPRLIDPGHARFVFVGDVDAVTLKTELERRFGAWSTPPSILAGLPPAAVKAAAPRIVLIDRPAAPQTVILLARPVPAPGDELERVARECLNTLFGSTFTSRLNRNLREEHGYTYGAGSAFTQRAVQHELYAWSSVQSEVTAAALGEFRKEFQGLASGDVTADELAKAVRTLRYELINTAETTGSLAGTLTELAADGRPLDAIATELASLERVELEAVNEIARSGLYEWDSLLVVLVGDAATVAAQLEAAGFPRPDLSAGVDGP